MQDNDARLAALHDLTNIPLDDLIDAYNTSDGDMSEKRRMVRSHLRNCLPLSIFQRVSQFVHYCCCLLCSHCTGNLLD